MLPDAIEPARDAFTNVDTAADDPAFLNFTSGTTGNPKGALQAHRSMLGHLPGSGILSRLLSAAARIPRGRRRIGRGSPVRWKTAPMPAWYHGVPVLTFRAVRFDPEQAFADGSAGTACARRSWCRPCCGSCVRCPIRSGGSAPTFARSIPAANRSARNCSSGSAEVLKMPINEVFGQTECNLVLGSNASVMPIKPGLIGRAVPGMSPESSMIPAKRCRRNHRQLAFRVRIR